MTRLKELKNLKHSLMLVLWLEPDSALRDAIENTIIELDAEISIAEIKQTGDLLAAVRELSGADDKEGQS